MGKGKNLTDSIDPLRSLNASGLSVWVENCALCYWPKPSKLQRAFIEKHADRIKEQLGQLKRIGKQRKKPGFMEETPKPIPSADPPRKKSKKKARSNNGLGKPAPGYRRNDGFYESREWREVRYAAIKLHGAACQCCGGTPADGIRIHVDHIKPRYTHPWLSLVLDNLQILCDDCNLGKGAWDDTDWRHFKSI